MGFKIIWKSRHQLCSVFFVFVFWWNVQVCETKYLLKTLVCNYYVSEKYVVDYIFILHCIYDDVDEYTREVFLRRIANTRTLYILRLMGLSWKMDFSLKFAFFFSSYYYYLFHRKSFTLGVFTWTTHTTP